MGIKGLVIMIVVVLMVAMMYNTWIVATALGCKP